MNLNTLYSLGIERGDVLALRRISRTLHHWHAFLCGTADGCIERDEKTGKPYFFNAHVRFVDPRDPRAWHVIPDREAGALKRLAAIMQRYPTLKAYVQTDPRGPALYILRPDDVPAGKAVALYYGHGVAVYK